MKAVQINDYGGVDVLHVTNNVPKPTPQKGQVLVEVSAATINSFDYKLRSGIYKSMIPLNFPMTVGADFAGTIVNVGEEVADFSVEDEVFGSAIVLAEGSGALAEFAVTNGDSIAKKPTTISLDQAASLPLVGSSAVQAVEEHINLQKGQKILIHGGAGGIGSVAIQLAKSKGAYVATTVSTNDVDFAKSLGADEVVDYKTQNFEELLKDVDAVFDTVGGETTTKSFQVLKPGGILVSMLGEPDRNLAEKYGVKIIGQNTKTNTAHLTRVAELVEQGVIRPTIEKEFTLDQVKDAFTYQEQVHPRGKVVVKIRE